MTEPFDLDLMFNGQHLCTHPGCDRTVGFDDEPFCFDHSPDSGSSVTGYSYRRDHPQQT